VNPELTRSALIGVRKRACVMAVVGYVHLGVLATRFEAEDVPVEALMFTDALSVDESKS
jgi:hypothetical protein